MVSQTLVQGSKLDVMTVLYCAPFFSHLHCLLSDVAPVFTTECRRIVVFTWQTTSNAISMLEFACALKDLEVLVLIKCT